MKKNKFQKLFVLLLLVVFAIVTVGCSTANWRAESSIAGAGIGAVTGAVIAGEKGAWIGAGVGSFIGYLIGENWPKPEGVHEKDLALKTKEIYLERSEDDALTAKINGASNCVAKGFAEAYCLETFGLKVVEKPKGGK